jgi:DNA anti-recombination protein RmuC
MAAKKAAKNAKLQIQFDKAKQAVEKALEMLDKKYEDVVKKINKLKELQIEIDMEI